MTAAPNWQNRTLFVADNIHILRGMNSQSVDCIATDPPFNAKRLFNAPLGSRAARQRFDDRWRWDEVTDEWHDPIASDHPAIKEIIEAAATIEGGGIDHSTGRISTGQTRNSIAAHLAWMAPRVVEMHRVLKPTGTLWLQCDTHAKSYMRLVLDAVFGRNLFVNELVRRRAPAKSDARTRLANNHDTILIYEKRKGQRKWRPSYEPYDLQRLQRDYTKDEMKRLSEDDQKTLKNYKYVEGPRRYRLDNLTSPQKNRPNLTYEFLGVTRVWRWTRERMEKAHKDGLVVQVKPGAVPQFKRYLDQQRGRLRDDCWMDVPDTDRNEEGWTTRKSLHLYTRIVECATDIGDVVLDPF